MAVHRSPPTSFASALLLLALALPATAAEPAAPRLLAPAPDAQATSPVGALDKVVPETLADLLAIEKQVQTVAEKVEPATVGLRIGRAQGSGVIVSEDGYVLTAAHVSGAPDRRVTVILPDGREVRGTSLGLNHGVDAGLVKILGEDKWPYVEMGDMQTVEPGDWCIATGHPGGYREGRSPVLRLGRIVQVRKSVIQTDCTLVGGDSGGPLFDMQGRVIGINSRIGTSTSWNFHVPISAYSDDWERLIDGEEFGFDDQPVAVLGVSGDDHAEGCRVTQVARGYPAEQAGLQVGDIIVRLDGKRFRGFDGLAYRVKQHQPGDEVTIEVLRDGETIELTAVLAKRE